MRRPNWIFNYDTQRRKKMKQRLLNKAVLGALLGLVTLPALAAADTSTFIGYWKLLGDNDALDKERNLRV